VLSSRASGTGNSARSAVYADGILLSNYWARGATYAPRWGLVTPEEIERVDVMYGPFAATPVTRWLSLITSPYAKHSKRWASLGGAIQGFNHYQTNRDFAALQG
jgi:iron complex outermembrane receptor protein